MAHEDDVKFRPTQLNTHVALPLVHKTHYPMSPISPSVQMIIIRTQEPRVCNFLEPNGLIREPSSWKLIPERNEKRELERFPEFTFLSALRSFPRTLNRSSYSAVVLVLEMTPTYNQDIIKK